MSRVDIYTKPTHRQDFGDWVNVGGYVVVLICAADTAEANKLDIHRVLMLPGDDWYGGTVERIASVQWDGSPAILRDAWSPWSGNGEWAKKHHYVSYGDTRVCWFFESYVEYEMALAANPPTERERRP